MINNKWGLWIGLHDWGKKRNKYTWLLTGNEITYNDWMIGEPNHENFPTIDGCNEMEHCVNIQMKWHRFGWNDLACCAETNFICEK